MSFFIVMCGFLIDGLHKVAELLNVEHLVVGVGGVGESRLVGLVALAVVGGGLFKNVA